MRINFYQLWECFPENPDKAWVRVSDGYYETYDMAVEAFTAQGYFGPTFTFYIITIS